MVLFTIFVLSFIISVNSLINREYNNYGIWTVINHFLMNPTFKISNTSSKVISLLLTLSVFLIVVLYIKNVITTDRFKMKEQKVYKSFAEIVDGIENGFDVNILYQSRSTLPSELSYPPFNYVRQKMKNYFIGKRAKPLLTFEALVTLSNNYENVIVGGLLTTLIIKYHGCKLAAAVSDPKPPETCLHRTPERDNSEQTINGIMVSKEFLTKNVYKKFQLKSRKNFEAGLRYQSILLRGSEVSEPQINCLDCLSESVNTKSYDPGNEPMNVGYFKNGFYSMFLLFCVSVIVLIVEIYLPKTGICNDMSLWKRRRRMKTKVKHVKMKLISNSLMTSKSKQKM